MSKGKLVFYRHNVLTAMFADTFKEPPKPWLNTGWGSWQCKRELNGVYHGYFEYGEFKDSLEHIMQHIPICYRSEDLMEFVRARLGNLAGRNIKPTAVHRTTRGGALIVLDIRWSTRPYAKMRIDGEIGIIPPEHVVKYAAALSKITL